MHTSGCELSALAGQQGCHWIGLLPGQPPENGLEIVAPWLQCDVSSAQVSGVETVACGTARNT